MGLKSARSAQYFTLPEEASTAMDFYSVESQQSSI